MYPPQSANSDKIWVLQQGTENLAGTVFGRFLAQSIQNGSSGDRTFVASTLKHWIGYGLPDSGRDRTNATVPPQLFARTVLPAPRNVLQLSKPLIVMVNSGPMNGIPLHADRLRVRELLRNRLGFDGVILSDYDDWVRIYNRYGYAKTLEEAFRFTLDAGLDIHLTENRVEVTCRKLHEMVLNGIIPETRIDDSVRRILELKQRLGLLDSNYGTLMSPLQHRKQQSHICFISTRLHRPRAPSALPSVN